MMIFEPYKQIEEWTEEDLLRLPSEENDHYEYKSSQIPMDRLKEKISIAASAFWNSGGGFFIVGINDTGHIDGGIAKTVGRQKLPDWIDQILLNIEPRGPYHIKMIAADPSQSLIAADKVVLVIGFGESHTGPHMAPDKKYYIRAGAHSGATGHFLVEAIRARRGIQMPMLRNLLRLHERKSQIIELVVTPLSDAPALNVVLTFNPFPKIIEQHFKDLFPIRIPVIDRANPFTMDLSTFGGNTEAFGVNPVYLHLEYDDIVGRHYTDQQLIDPLNGIGPLKIGDEMGEKVHRALKEIAKQLATLGKALRD